MILRPAVACVTVRGWQPIAPPSREFLLRSMGLIFNDPAPTVPICCAGVLLSDRKGGSRAAALEFPDRDTELLGLVGQVVLDASARKHHDPDRQNLQHRVVSLERCRLGVPGPVGLERDLRHLAVVGPACGDAFGTLR